LQILYMDFLSHMDAPLEIQSKQAPSYTQTTNPCYSMSIFVEFYWILKL
jgi:hypothetical protein